MFSRKTRCYSFALIFLSLLVFISACGDAPNPSVANHTDGPAIYASSSPQANSTPTPSTKVTCPASGTARAAIMPALALGTHPTVVYAWNQTNSATLRRYDSTNGSKSDIVTLPNVVIRNAQVSSDGQWILFVTNGKTLQLIRIDGKYLQILYCSGNNTIDVVRWSTDQKTIALEENASSLKNNPILTLNLASGTLQAVSNGSMTLDVWLDNSHLVVENSMSSSSSGPMVFYLVDITALNTQPQSWPVIWQGQPYSHMLIATTNSNVLYLSQAAYIQAQTNAGQPSSIQSLPVSGALPSGWPQQIMVSPGVDIGQIALVNAQSLLYVTSSSLTNTGLWTVSTDGNQQVKHLIVTNYSQAGEQVSLNSYSSDVWSNVSRDGTMYAIRFITNIGQSLLIGSVTGGKASAFAQASTNYDDILEVAGWTTF